jgi:hypothetical protein
MRRTVLIAMPALLLALAGVVAIPALSQASDGDPTKSRTLTFDVQFSPFTSIAANNTPDPNSPFSLGDEIVFHDLLFLHGKQVGDDAGSCVLVALAPGVLANCSAVFRLPEGTISTQFVSSPGPAPKAMALTGGTGAYRGIGGEGTLVEFGDETGTVTFQVLSFAARGGTN